jgi:hypothetical protein
MLEPAMLSRWTIRRATGTGLVAALAALILWPAYAAWQEPLRVPYLAALWVTALCGLSILIITAADIAMKRRGQRLVAVRTFDLVLALGLALPALLALASLLG